MQHLVLRRSWTGLGRRHGRIVLSDHVHLAEPGAQLIADLVEEFLNSP